MGGLGTLIPFILIALVFWLLIVRPQRKRQQDLRSTQSALGIGSEVVLGSGIYGTVAALGDDTLQLELSPGTHVKVARQAVVRVVQPVESVEPVELQGPDEVDGEGDDDVPGPTGPLP